jgi:hypothetical protein
MTLNVCVGLFARLFEFAAPLGPAVPSGGQFLDALRLAGGEVVHFPTRTAAFSSCAQNRASRSSG